MSPLPTNPPPSLQLVVLRSGELIVGDESVLVLVFVLKDLLDQFVVLAHHILELLGVLALSRGHLFVQVAADLENKSN